MPTDLPNKKTTYLNNSNGHVPATRRVTGPLDAIIPWVIEFRVIGTVDIVKAPIDEVITIGRGDASRGVIPDIDLEPYGGQDKGVSRRHAKLVVKDNRITVQDENSANGTFLNSEQLTPEVAYRLRHGDRLRLGKLELQAHFIVKPLQDEKTSVGTGNLMNIPQVGEGQRILVLDDDDDVLFVVGYVVERAGFKPITVNTAADAIMHIDDHMPDMLITELVLSETNGENMVRYIRQKQGSRYVPIMAITGATAGFKMGAALKEGADMTLGKPIAVDELLNGLKKMLELVK